MKTSGTYAAIGNIYRGLLAALALWASAAATHAEQITLRVTHAFPAREAKFRTDIAQQFMARNPGIQIKLEATATDCGALLQQLLRAAITNDLPDVTTPCYQEAGLLADRNLLAPLDDFVAKDAAWKELGIEPAALSTTHWNGKLVALPESVSTSIVYYNMNVVRKIRPDLSSLPATWPEIIALANSIKKQGGDVMSIFFEYYPDNFNWSFNGLVYSHGGDMFSPEGRIAFDGEAGKKSLALMKEFGQAGMVDMTTEQARQAFVAGKIGIYVASNSRLAQLTANAGEQLEIRTAAYPQSARNGKLQSGGGAIAILTRDEAKQKAAWEYLKFAIGPAAQTTMVKNTGFAPVNTRAVESAEFLADYYKDRANDLVAIRQLPRIKSMNTYPGEKARQISTVIRDHLQAVVTLKRTPEEVMPDMVRDVERLLPAAR
jgi:multiple sugar transport system substrate-binding protein